MTRLPLHADVPGYHATENRLWVGDRSVEDIVKEAGRTPLYCYDAGLIGARIQELRSALPERLKLHYAIKANPMPNVIEFVSRRVDGLDVASGGELELALACQIPPSEISFAGPGKTDAELEQAIGAQVVINAESIGELQRASAIAERNAKRAQVAIRVNPDFELKGSGMKMSGGPKPFGIDAECVPQAIQLLQGLNVDFRGFHIFSGSQNLSAQSICDSQSQAVDLALELAKGRPESPDFINIGGGFGIPYFPGDGRLEIEPISRHLDGLLAQVAKVHPTTSIVLELGRYLVGEAGLYVCRVIEKKVSRGQEFLITDGGLHHHLAASGNFGQILRKNYPVLNANRVAGETHVTNVVGPLCTPLDIIGDKIELPETEVGDLLVVFQSGAYGFTASPRGFLSHPEPLEVFLSP